MRKDGKQAGDGRDSRQAAVVQRAGRRHHRPHQGQHQLRQWPYRHRHQPADEILGEKGETSYPWKSLDSWFVAENIRWGKFPGTTDIKAMVDATNRSDLWLEAAKGLGLADMPSGTAAASRPSSTARLSIRPIRPPISTALRSRRWPDDAGRREAAGRSIPSTEASPMSLPAAKSDVVVAGPFKQRPAPVVPLAVKTKRFDINAIMVGAAQTILPPLVVLAIILAVWQAAFSGPEASLPPPSEVWAQSKDLIIDPFFVNGSQDIGLGLRVLVSLERVAYGFGLAAVIGVLLGALIGQSVWAMRGLDPIFQVLRTVPPLAWLPLSLAAFLIAAVGDFRDLYHVDLAGDHQYRRRHPQYPARLPQRLYNHRWNIGW